MNVCAPGIDRLKRDDVLKLNLGCGTNKLDGWENHDVDVDLRAPLPWPDGAAEFILLERVLEHFNSSTGYSMRTNFC